jgi:hypothetical protein
MTKILLLKGRLQSLKVRQDFFFSAFADITAQVKKTGSGVYNLSELDLRDVIDYYCGNATNFGWAIIVVYKNANLPLNQLTVYDGLQYVPNEINITLKA